MFISPSFLCDKAFLERKNHISVFTSHWSLEQIASKMNPRFKCPICAQDFAINRSLKTHIKKRHGDKGQIKCTHCEEKFVLKADYEGHLEKVKNKTEKMCILPESICDKRKLLWHERSAHASVQGEAEEVRSGGSDELCEVCNSRFKKSFWYAHQRSHTHISKLMERYAPRVKIHESCFKNACATYELQPDPAVEEEKVDTQIFLANSKKIVIPLLECEVLKRGCL